MGQKFLQFPPVSFVADVVRIYFSRRVGRASAQLAYFMVLTFFPILICISAFVGRLNLNMSNLLAQAEQFLPSVVYTIFQEYLSYLDANLSVGMLIAGIFMAVLFASAAVRGLMNIMEEIYGHRSFHGIRQIGASVLFSVFLLITIYLSIVVVVTGNWFFHMLGKMLGLQNLVEIFDAWQWLKYLILLAIVFLFIFLLYRFVAPLGKPRPPVITGALLASVALAAASMLFSLIMSGSTRYSLVYGSLASLILLLVWLYLCGHILILGNVVNFVIYDRKKKKSIRSKAEHE